MKEIGTSESISAKRQKLSQSAAGSDVDTKCRVVIGSVKRCVLAKSGPIATTSSSVTMTRPSLNSSMDTGSEHRRMGGSMRQVPSMTGPNGGCKNFVNKLIPAPPPGKHDVEFKDMIFDSAIAAAEQANSAPAYLHTEEEKNCPMCDVTIGSIDDMCLHIQQFHNVAFQSDGRVGNRPMYGRVGPTNCLGCDTLFDSRLEMSRHKQFCTGKVRQKQAGALVSCYICAACSVVIDGRHEFDVHVKTFHGGSEAYQRIVLSKMMLVKKPSVGEVRVPVVNVASKRNYQCTEAKSNTLKNVPCSRVQDGEMSEIIKHDSSDPEITQTEVSCTNKEAGTKKLTMPMLPRKSVEVEIVGVERCLDAAEKDLISNPSDIECSSTAPVLNVPKTEPDSSSIEESSTVSNSETILLDPVNVIQTSLRVEDMVSSITVNRALDSRNRSVMCVGKIKKADVVMSDVESNPSQEAQTKKQVNPQLPVVFDITALQRIFIENGRRRVRLQTSLIPGSDIVVVGTEDILSSKIVTIKETSRGDVCLTSKKLLDNVEQERISSGSTSKPTSAVDTTKVRQKSALISEQIEDMKPDGSNLITSLDLEPVAAANAVVEKSRQVREISGEDDTNQSICVEASSDKGESDEQQMLLLALHLVPSSSVHSPERSIVMPIVRKSKRQMAKKTDDTVKSTTVEKRAMEVLASKRDIKLNHVMSRVGKDLKTNKSNESGLVDAQCTQGMSLRERVSSRLSTISPKSSAQSKLSGLVAAQRGPVGDITETRRQSRSVNDIKLLARSGECIKSFSEPLESGALVLTDSPTLRNEPIEPVSSATLDHGGNGGGVEYSEPLASDELAPSVKFVTDSREPIVVTDSTNSNIACPTVSLIESTTNKTSEECLSKKVMRRNLRILEPIDDETLKCLECGSILHTAIAIISHSCTD